MPRHDSIYRLLRDCLGLTAGEMAARCGISAPYWSELERGAKANPSDETLGRIAAACGLHPATLGLLIGHADPAGARRWLVSKLAVLPDVTRARYEQERSSGGPARKPYVPPGGRRRGLTREEEQT